MDRAREALARADRHVVESRERIAKQQALIEQLEHDGHDSSMAKALLQEFRHSLQLHIAGRAAIEADLARSASNPQVAASGTAASTRDPEQNDAG